MTPPYLPEFPTFDVRKERLRREAERTLGLAFACDFSDPLLEDISLIRVEAAPGAHCLSILLSAPQHTDKQTLQDMYERLAAMKGYLRSRIARAMRRKRVPDLQFRISLHTG